MINIDNYINEFYRIISIDNLKEPWEIISDLENIIADQILKLNTDYKIENNIAIHKLPLLNKE